MDLSNFIEETLISLKKGIQNANKETGSNDFQMMHQDKVDFDVALVISDKKSGEGDIKIGVASLASADGKIKTEKLNSDISRIKFSIKIGFNCWGGVNHDE
jgi:hypothetical protein